jgi:hypothetical protein
VRVCLCHVIAGEEVFTLAELGGCRELPRRLEEYRKAAPVDEVWCEEEEVGWHTTTPGPAEEGF